MTATPEAFLAREAEMSYAVMAHITDYDVWHESEEPVTVEAVIRVLLRNAEVAKQSVDNAVRMLAQAGPSPYRNALQDAIITQRGLWPEQAVQQLDLLDRQVRVIAAAPRNDSSSEEESCLTTAQKKTFLPKKSHF